VIGRARGGTIEDLKLRKEEEKGALRWECQTMTTDLIQVGFEAIPLP
jgi:hypothetical protein